MHSMGMSMVRERSVKSFLGRIQTRKPSEMTHSSSSSLYIPKSAIGWLELRKVKSAEVLHCGCVKNKGNRIAHILAIELLKSQHFLSSSYYLKFPHYLLCVNFCFKSLILVFFQAISLLLFYAPSSSTFSSTLLSFFVPSLFPISSCTTNSLSIITIAVMLDFLSILLQFILYHLKFALIHI